MIHAHSQPYLEVAVYKVNEPDAFLDIRRRTVEQAKSRMEGLIHWTPLVSEDGLYADVVVWKTPEQATEAAAQIQVDEAFAPFIYGINEIKHFMHYTSSGNEEDLLIALQANEFVELALYSVIDPAIFRPAQQQLHKILSEREIPRYSFALDADEDQSGYGDFAIWPDSESWQATGTEIADTLGVSAMFKQIEHVHVFSLFKRQW